MAGPKFEGSGADVGDGLSAGFNAAIGVTGAGMGDSGIGGQ